ncbi:sulfur carrier protein ThiS adenylyltransferase [Desulfonispora thiosulfatigenes DSM 11270]|uniref:Sulfur carrier protein ThiS adenylyltransferase n=1 Tax=Desulfonispora thiosulfatigenes DSM 11270 TaxID=656914 RepID=A0A1W1V1Z7_DESTI|nr:sulfur carrier protein ThiS adenylyltransferase ThiF [Desulfonispora thiosulfatigenes]SMB87320.1 sulfur carrier protein ThiS adenylyltransferase [Desulfonispora thiosulfatigenes DSM 11270]
MKVYVNENPKEIKEGTSLFELKDIVKKDTNIIVLNGAPITKDRILNQDDRITFIKKGQIPSKEELEALLVARHTPGVHAKVKKSIVGIAGLGGLGSNVAISLARLGIGKLILVDFDRVEPSNLNRQQYFTRHIGMMKTKALEELIKEINPFVKIETKDIFLDQDNLIDCFKEVEIIVEALDNPESKANLVNTVLTKDKEKIIVAASGMAGYFSNNTIKTKKIRDNFYLIGDDFSEVQMGCGLMAPRVAIAANHQANTVLRIILGETEV